MERYIDTTFSNEESAYIVQDKPFISSFIFQHLLEKLDSLYDFSLFRETIVTDNEVLFTISANLDDEFQMTEKHSFCLLSISTTIFTGMNEDFSMSIEDKAKCLMSTFRYDAFTYYAVRMKEILSNLDVVIDGKCYGVVSGIEDDTDVNELLTATLVFASIIDRYTKDELSNSNIVQAIVRDYFIYLMIVFSDFRLTFGVPDRYADYYIANDNEELGSDVDSLATLRVVDSESDLEIATLLLDMSESIRDISIVHNDRLSYICRIDRLSKVAEVYCSDIKINTRE